MTYYEILNIKINATDKEIKNAYRSLAKKYHPDTYKGNKNVAEEKMKQINEAYDVLSNKELKDKYDEQFRAKQASPIDETEYKKSYYNYETNEYRSPDPREADYRSYYNYSPEYEYEPEYDFSKLKNLFSGSILKIVFLGIGIITVLSVLIYLVNEIRVQAMSIFEYNEPVKEPYQTESVPQNNYHEEVQQVKPDINYEKEDKVNIPQINDEEIKEQINKWEESLNKWYETEGKQYEEHLKNEINLFYQEFVNQLKP